MSKHNQAGGGSSWCPNCQRYVSDLHDKHTTDGWYE